MRVEKGQIDGVVSVRVLVEDMGKAGETEGDREK